jgi:uncharacterized protein (UPF0248 family)
MKKTVIFFLLLYICHISSCASLLLASLINEQKDTEGKIVISLENKTDETLALFLVEEFFPGNKKLWVQLARIPPHTIQEVRVSQGKTIRIIGGNSRIEYTDIACIYEDFIIIYPQKNIPYVPENVSHPML